MGAGKNKSHRKKRISKHVLDAQERKKRADVENKLLSAADQRQDEDVGAPTSAGSEGAGAGGAVTARQRELKTKDPEEASSYLTLWKYDRVHGTKQWKFNKNTQSWLLRHMYDFDKVTKNTFALLVEYLCRGGEGLCSRVEEEAKRRARRYKLWEKENQQKNKDEKGGDSNGDGGGDEAAQKVTEDSGKRDTKLAENNDETAWKEMNEHDKRKEYKRARKVLDSLKDGKQ